MIVDANILLYAVDAVSVHHQRARSWLTEQLLGTRRVGLPWESLVAFVRISTHPRASDRPLSPTEAWRFVEEWLAVPVVWVPTPTEEHGQVLGQLIAKYGLAGNLVSDAHLAALAIEHGLEIWSADTDFARFTEVRWRNPLAVGR
jgi:toxin-antitoxin system PIN domain toxin